MLCAETVSQGLVCVWYANGDNNLHPNEWTNQELQRKSLSSLPGSISKHYNNRVKSTQQVA